MVVRLLLALCVALLAGSGALGLPGPATLAPGVADAHPAPGDRDGDEVGDAVDNCPDAANGSQKDTDKDGFGDACDGDDDADAVGDATDNCRLVANPDQANADGDAYGDACPPVDSDADGRVDPEDNCPTVGNAGQVDFDGDDKGDACDRDADGDQYDDYGGVDPRFDNCPRTYNPEQTDADRDGVGTACDPEEPLTAGSAPVPRPGTPDPARPDAPSRPPGAGGPADRAAPTVSIGRRLALGDPPVVTISCSEACALEVALGTDARAASRHRLPRRLAGAAWALRGRGRAYVFLDWRRGAARAARGRRAAGAPVRVSVLARDAAGNVRRVSRTLRLPRAATPAPR